MKTIISNIGIIDIIDLALVSFLVYQFYKLIKGTAALNIFFGILSIYIFYLLTKYFELRLLSGLLEQFFNFGILIMVIVFQQEIRRFLLVIGKSGVGDLPTQLKRFLKIRSNEASLSLKWIELEKAIMHMSASKTGALIILSDKNDVKSFEGTGVKLNAELTSELLENIFFKNSPLHDGAVYVLGTKLKEAKIVLPLSDSADLPSDAGMRHRAALGASELFDVFVIVVSEQTGNISYAYKDRLVRNVNIELLRKRYKEYKERKL